MQLPIARDHRDLAFERGECLLFAAELVTGPSHLGLDRLEPADLLLQCAQLWLDRGELRLLAREFAADLVEVVHQLAALLLLRLCLLERRLRQSACGFEPLCLAVALQVLPRFGPRRIDDLLQRRGQGGVGASECCARRIA